VIGTALSGLAVLYLTSYLTSYINPSLAPIACLLALTVGITLVWRARGSEFTPLDRGARQVEGALVVVALSLPVLLYLFGHLTTERYVWLIAQNGICAHLFSAALLFASVIMGGSLAVGALGILIATRRPGDVLFPRLGLVVGFGVVTALAVIAVLAPPELGARLLACTV
jgi:hypothetical protein